MTLRTMYVISVLVLAAGVLGGCADSGATSMGGDSAKDRAAELCTDAESEFADIAERDTEVTDEDVEGMMLNGKMSVGRQAIEKQEDLAEAFDELGDDLENLDSGDDNIETMADELHEVSEQQSGEMVDDGRGAVITAFGRDFESAARDSGVDECIDLIDFA